MRERMWGIKGRLGNGREFFYCDMSLTRRDAIRDHAAAKKGGGSTQKDWAACRREGDRAVRIEVREVK